MNLYEYKEYDENDMIQLYEYCKFIRRLGNFKGFCIIKFSTDYNYGMVTYDSGDRQLYKVGNMKNMKMIFEYDMEDTLNNPYIEWR